MKIEEEIQKAVDDLMEASYDTGYISAKIEAGEGTTESYHQSEAIIKRRNLRINLLKMINHMIVKLLNE